VSNYKTRFKRKDGTVLWVSISVNSIVTEDGQKLHISCAEDITERKQAEGELRESELKLRELFDSASDGISTVDSNGVYTEVNQRLLEMNGLTVKAEMVGKNAVEFIAIENRESTLAQLEEALVKGKISQMEIMSRRPDGSEFPTELSVSPLKDDSGYPTGFIGIARDITERKQVEEKLRQSLAELQRSNGELENFAYVASHDLQEPLRMVSSFVQLLEKRYQDKLDGDAHDYIGFAVDGARRMQQLINDLLAYSRVGTRGRQFQPTDCAVVFDAAVANLNTRIRESGTVVTRDPLPAVMADEGQLVQLLQNLIDNSIKFQGEQLLPCRIISRHEMDWSMPSVRPKLPSNVFTAGSAAPGTNRSLA